MSAPTNTVKHTSTPGPWTAKWSKYRDGVFIVQAGMPSNRVLAQFDGDGDGPDEQSIADAHLIAAAPDLLDALQSLFASYKDLADSGDAGFWSLEDQPVGKQALAAIAKATGSPAPQEKGGE